MIHPLVGATGKALGLIAALLQRGGVATVGEFADLLSALGSASAADEPMQYEALITWAEAVRQAGSPERGVLLANADALVALAALLNQGEVIRWQETGELLGLYACTVAEANADEGDILGYWAGTIKASLRSA